MDDWKNKFMKSIKTVELNDEGKIVALKGYISRSTEDMN